MFDHFFKNLVAYRFKYPHNFSRACFSLAVSFSEPRFWFHLSFFFSRFFILVKPLFWKTTYIVSKIFKMPHFLVFFRESFTSTLRSSFYKICLTMGWKVWECTHVSSGWAKTGAHLFMRLGVWDKNFWALKIWTLFHDRIWFVWDYLIWNYLVKNG